MTRLMPSPALLLLPLAGAVAEEGALPEPDAALSIEQRLDLLEQEIRIPARRDGADDAEAGAVTITAGEGGFGFTTADRAWSLGSAC